MLRLGLPLIPAWLGRSALDFVDRGLVNALGGTAMLGLYALGARLAEQLRMLMSGPFSDIWRVRMMERASRPEAAAEFNRAQVFFLALMSLAVFALSALAPEIVKVIAAPAFQGAAAAVPLLALSHLLRTVAYHFQLGLLERKRTGSLPVVNWSTVALGALALWLLIPPFGVVGAAAAILLAQACRLVLSAWFAALHSDYARLFPWRSYAGLLTLTVVFMALAASIDHTAGDWPASLAAAPGWLWPGWQATTAKLGLICLFVPALLLGPVFTAEERRFMREGLRTLLRRE
jgi:O-antigen/teichoic acid export membrane protein